jgi:hypothetical protein
MHRPDRRQGHGRTVRDYGLVLLRLSACNLKGISHRPSSTLRVSRLHARSSSYNLDWAHRESGVVLHKCLHRQDVEDILDQGEVLAGF